MGRGNAYTSPLTSIGGGNAYASPLASMGGGNAYAPPLANMGGGNAFSWRPRVLQTSALECWPKVRRKLQPPVLADEHCCLRIIASGSAATARLSQQMICLYFGRPFRGADVLV